MGNVLKEGQMASMQFCRKAPACTQRMAVHIIATKAIQNVSYIVPKAFKKCAPLITIAG